MSTCLQISHHEEGCVRVLGLNRPRGNILDSEMMESLAAAFDPSQAPPKLRLLVLRGVGGNFSYGASVPEHRKDQAPAMLQKIHELVRRIARYPVPVAALVEGCCLGGAFELVLACHLVFAVQGARMGCPEIKLGVFPPVFAALGSYRLGAPTAERMLLTGCELSAQASLERGLSTAVFAQGDEPLHALLAWYGEHLAPLSAFALRQSVRAVRRPLEPHLALLDANEQQYLEQLLPSHDGNEGIEAFLAKRKPVWLDR